MAVRSSVGAALVAVALLVSCERSAEGPRPSASAAPSTVSPTTAGPSGPLVAVISRSGGLTTFRVQAAQRRLTSALTRSAPRPAAKAVAVAVSGGAAPTVCAVWEDSETTLTCYDADQRAGRTIRTGVAGAPFQLALSASGEHIGWVARSAAAPVPDVYFGRLASDAVTDVRRVPGTAQASRDPEDDVAVLVGGLAWHRDEALLITAAYDSDLNGSLYRLPVTAPPNAVWLDTTVLTDSREDPVEGLSIYANVTSSTTSDEALLLQRGAGSRDDSEPDSRAVRVDLRSGRVVSVVSVPLPRRSMLSVSGGAGGVLYQTSGDGGDDRTYWRNPGESKGEPLTGVPADALIVVAQP